jgi:hypothetical protein
MSTQYLFFCPLTESRSKRIRARCHATSSLLPEGDSRGLGLPTSQVRLSTVSLYLHPSLAIIARLVFLQFCWMAAGVYVWDWFQTAQLVSGQPAFADLWDL